MLPVTKNSDLMHNCSKQSQRKKLFFVSTSSVIYVRVHTVFEVLKYETAYVYARALADLCPARTKMKINVINLRPRTHIFYLDLSPRRCMGGGSYRDSTEQQWAYSSFMIGTTQSGMILRSIQVQGLSCCSLYNIIRINIHLFLTVQRKRNIDNCTVSIH
jgi:hypothetical protein